MKYLYLGLNRIFGVLLLVATAALAGCQTMADKGPIRAVVWQSSVAGWAVVCGDHELLIDPLCRISRGPLVYTIQALPVQFRKPVFATENLQVGANHHPGSIVFIRSGNKVADGYEPSIYSDMAKPILMAGGDVYVRWTEWPSDSQSETVRIDGFVDAYGAAMEQIRRMAGEPPSAVEGDRPR